MTTKRLFLLALAVLTWGLLSSRLNAAGKVDDLVKALLSDSSYKVRTQAALLLGKLGDKAATPALATSLSDESKTVRAMSAQSLGKIGGDLARSTLRASLSREQDPFVRTQIERALAVLSPEPKSVKADRVQKLFVTIGSFSGGSKAADPALLARVRTHLRQALEKLPTLAFSDGSEITGSTKGERAAFLVDGNVNRLEEVTAGSAIETKCEVKVMVARWPSRSIILWTSAGAAVTGGRREREKKAAQEDCLEASMNQLGESLIDYFKTQGT